MKHWLSSSVLVVIACAPASELAAQNLVANGGFEEVAEDGGPAAWSFEGAGRMAMGAGGLVPAARSGRAALALASNFELADFFGYSDPFELGDANELLVTCYYHTRSTPRVTIALATSHGPVPERLWERPPVQLEFRALPAAKPWRLMSCHFRVSPAAHYGMLLFRVGGKGVLTVDDVAVVAYPNRLEAEMLLPGLVVGLPNKRIAQARVHNVGKFQIDGIAELVATAEKGHTVTQSMPFNLAPNAETVLDIAYPFDVKQRHTATFTFFDSKRLRVFEQLVFEAPSLVEVHPIVPAFRSSVLSTMPTDTYRALCRINAAQPIAEQIKLTAVLRDTSGEGVEVGVSITEGADCRERELRAPTGSLRPGKYELVVTARARRGRLLAARAPLWVLESRRWEIGYDQYGVLRISGRPMFPIGVLGIESAKILKRLAEAGLNCVFAPGDAIRLDFLDEAHLRGIKVVVVLQPSTSMRTGASLRRLAAHPALLGWYVVEAPGHPSASPAVGAELRARFASLDPYHPVIGPPAGPPYALQHDSGADVLLTESRPIIYWPLTTLAEQLDLARRPVRGLKPVWAAVQTDGLAWRIGQGLSKSGEGRPPTPEELRCMVYLAIVHGARGMVYSAYHIPSRRGAPELLLPRDCPELWRAVVRTNEELRDLAPALLAPKGPRRLEAEPAGVHAALIGDGREQALIAVNPTPEPLTARIRLPFAPPQPVQPYFAGDARPEVEDRTLSQTLPPRAVRVFRVPEHAEPASVPGPPGEPER